MTKAAPDIATEIDIWRLQTTMAREVARINIHGLTHEDSLVQPQPGGNCINWVLGHLLITYDQLLELLGAQPVLGRETLRSYARGARPIVDRSAALDFERLASAWEEASKRVDAALGSVTPELLERPVPNSPSGNPDETIRTLLTTVMWHQAYHAGQLGVLRRIAGKEGAIS